MNTKNVRIWSCVGDAWKTMWKNPLVFTPSIMSFLAMMVYIILITLILTSMYGEELVPESFPSIQALILTGLLVLIGFFLLGALINSVMVSTFHLVITKKTLTLKNIFTQALRLYWRVIRVILLKILISIPVLLLLGVLLSILLSTVQNTALIVSLTAFTLLALLVMLYLFTWFVFIDPMIALEKKAFTIISKAWHLLHNDTMHVWKTSLTYIFVATAFAFISAIIFTFIPEEGVISSLVEIITFIIQLILSAWMIMFVFSSYHQRYHSRVHSTE